MVKKNAHKKAVTKKITLLIVINIYYQFKKWLKIFFMFQI